MMDVTRRDFLKISGATTAGLMLGTLFDMAPIKAYATANPPQWDTVTTSICCYCAVGCGLLVATSTTDPDAVYVQGDPDHPINQGSLCSKGQAMAQLHTVDGAVNPGRLTQPLYRPAGGTVWQTKTWAEAMTDIALKIKATRDATTVVEELIDGDLTPVNRCTGIACLGGAAHDNEECYLLVKLMRALGLVYIEHQARI
jgi:formate dehydrogenase major subunit